ncbi:MAG: FG-GAP repeat domain-containing protein [Planctomycetota bacterium]|jgi:hypothetical protein
MKKLILALTWLFLAVSSQANPIPWPPPASMPLEDMHIEIGPAGDGLGAVFTGDFTFTYIPNDVLSMLFPVPPDANNIRVWQDGVELPWTWSSERYPTVLPEMPTIPMVEWLGPFPEAGAVFRVDYEHSLIKRPGESIFFYAVGTGKYFSTYEKTTTAYFDILLPRGYKVNNLWLDDVPHSYQVDGYHLTLTVQSEFGPIVNDLIVSLLSDPGGDDCNGNGIPDGEDLYPPIDLSDRSDYTVASGPAAIASADLNGDLVPDLAVVNNGSEKVSVLINNGSGMFPGAHTHYAVGDNPTSVVATDLDGDGDFDLAVANKNSDNISLLFNNGDGTFAAKVDCDGGNGACSVHAADFDGDDDNDLVVANMWDRNISILLNNGVGVFSPQVNYTVDKYPRSVACGDFNNDQRPDLAVGGQYSFAVLLNRGNGIFDPAVYYDIGHWPEFVACGDFDLDDDLDLAVADTGINIVTVLYNDGAGTFTAGPSYGIRSEPLFIIAGDLDDNGSLDLGVSCVDAPYPDGSPAVSILLNNGDGSFRPGRDVEITDFPGGGGKIVAAKLNNDSLPDLAVAYGYGTHEVGVLLNQTPPPASHDWDSSGVPDECENLITGDLDFDGDFDKNDLSVFCDHWLLESCRGPVWCDGTDMDENHSVDFSDFNAFAGIWLEQ